jgi:hypothetical protein
MLLRERLLLLRRMLLRRNGSREDAAEDAYSAEYARPGFSFWQDPFWLGWLEPSMFRTGCWGRLWRLLRLLRLDHSIDDQFGSHITDMMTAYNFLKLPPLPLHILQYEVAVLVFFPNSSAT